MVMTLFWICELLPFWIAFLCSRRSYSVPAWVYISIGVMTALGLGAYYKIQKKVLLNNRKIYLKIKVFCEKY